MRNSVLELCDAVCDYLENPDKLKAMSNTLENEFSGCASQAIREYILKDVDCVYGRL